MTKLADCSILLTTLHCKGFIVDKRNLILIFSNSFRLSNSLLNCIANHLWNFYFIKSFTQLLAVRKWNATRGVSRTAATSKMELFVKIVNGFSCVEDLSDPQNILPDFSRHTTVEEAYSEPSQRYKMKLLVKIVNSFQLLAFFAKKLNFRVSFLNRDSFHARRNSHYMAWSNKNNKKEKMKSIWESYLEWTKNNKCLLTLDLKPFRS